MHNMSLHVILLHEHTYTHTPTRTHTHAHTESMHTRHLGYSNSETGPRMVIAMEREYAKDRAGRDDLAGARSH